MEHGIAHPWMTHFKDAYPEEAWERIEALGFEVKQAALDI